MISRTLMPFGPWDQRVRDDAEVSGRLLPSNTLRPVTWFGQLRKPTLGVTTVPLGLWNSVTAPIASRNPQFCVRRPVHSSSRL